SAMRVVPSSATALAPCPRRSIACEDHPRRASSSCQKVHTPPEFAAPCTRITGGRASPSTTELCARRMTIPDLLRPTVDCQACWNRGPDRIGEGGDPRQQRWCVGRERPAPARSGERQDADEPSPD